MKTYKLVFGLIFLVAFVRGYAQFNKNSEKEIVIGVIDSLYSVVLKEQREIWVSAPKNFDRSKRYPVIYVLDANKNFSGIVGMMKHLTPHKMPKSIIVGVTNTDRTRDFTPTHVPFQRGQKSETSGQAESFIQFINEELKPYINRNYSVEKNTTIIGHSTGGLLVLYTYLFHQDSFDNYIAIDPSLWWDKEYLVKAFSNEVLTINRTKKSLYIAVANSIGKTMDTVKVRKDKSVPTEQIRANLKFHDILVKHNDKLNFEWEYYKNEDHGSVVIPAQYNGLSSVFSWFPFPEKWRFNTPKAYTIEELTEPYYTHYSKLSKRFKREMKPDWELVNDIGFYMLNGYKLPEKARAFLEMNLDFYPNESISYVALGDFYLSQKEIIVAKEYYKKAIDIDGNKQAQEKLNNLKL